MSDTRSGTIHDTRPLAEALLSREQSTFIKRMIARIDALAAAPPSRPTRRNRSGWSIELDPDRSYRSLLIDSGRGTGKTSLMLTALQRLFDRPQPWSVQVLQPIDFDPLPRHQGAYTWLVLGFRALCERLDEGEGRVGTPWLDERHDDQPRRHTSLRAWWRELYRMALTGWGSFADKVADRDIDDFIDDHQAAGQRWVRMGAEWRNFVDALAQRCEARGWLAPGGALLLPIDDLDLTPHLALDILQALRHLQHPRLITLITGDSLHMRRVLARRIASREADRGPLSQGDREQSARDAEGLARAYMDKVIPHGMRLEPPSFGTREAFAMAAHRWSDSAGTAWRETSDETRSRWLNVANQALGSANDVASLLDGGGDVSPVPGAPMLAEGFRVRDLAHAIDGAAGEPGSAALARELLKRLLDSVRVEEQGRLPEHPFTEDLERRFSKHVAELAPLEPEWFDRIGVTQAIGLCLGKGEERFTLGPLARLRLQLGLDDARLALAWQPVAWSPLVQSDRVAASAARMAWPTRAEVPWTWADAHRWSAALAAAAHGDTQLGVLAVWLDFHARWITGGGLEPQPGDSSAEETFDATLAAAIKLAGSDNRWRDWLTQRFPILCGPAYGLDVETKAVILRALVKVAREYAEWSAWCGQWRKQYGVGAHAAAARTGDLRPDRFDPQDDSDPWRFSEHLWQERRWFETRVSARELLSGRLDSARPSGIDPGRPSDLLGLRLPDMLPGKLSGHLADHWGTRALEEALNDPRRRQRFVTALAGRPELENEALLAWFIEGWRTVAGLHGLDEQVGYWFEVTDDARNLIWAGPADIQLVPRLTDPERFGDLTVRRLDGWTVTEQDLPPALTGWLGVMQTIGFVQTRPDARFERWLTPPMGLAIEGEVEWDLPPIDTWVAMEAFACLWNHAIDAMTRDTRGMTVRAKYLELRWLLWINLLVRSQDDVTFNDQLNELKVWHVDDERMIDAANNLVRGSNGWSHRLFSWFADLHPEQPLRRWWSGGFQERDEKELRSSLMSLPNKAARWFKRTDVAQEIQTLYSKTPPGSEHELREALSARLGAAFTPWVERRLRDYFLAPMAI